MKKSSLNQQDVAEKIKQQLNQHDLHHSTLQVLDRARQNALKQDSIWSFQFAKPILAFASVSAISLAIFLTIQSSTSDITPDSVEAFEMLSNNDALEMYENLEFYLWLDEELKS